MTFDAEAMAQLEGMGFPAVRCQKALLATGNSDANAAMEWLFLHMDDPGRVLAIITEPWLTRPHNRYRRTDTIAQCGLWGISP